MSASELQAGRAAKSGVTSEAWLLAACATAIFLSAALLFAVEPMFTKAVVPRLGGAAAVWSVAMVFFQATMLAGYIYAHVLTRFAPGRTSIIIHLALMSVACLALPLHIAAGWGHPPQSGQATWLLGLFTASIGLPFFALSANAPLLQAWFARTTHPDARDPYFLYAASNAGSFLALLAYPLAIEPSFLLTDQVWYWTTGFYALIALIAGSGLLALGTSSRSPVAAGQTIEVLEQSWQTVGSWVALSAVPSGLLIAVTAHIATDVAAVPLLWILPLALYLLTFVLVFQNNAIIPHGLVVKIQPIFVLGLVLVLVLKPIESTPILIAIHLCVFFVCSLMCHGELAKRRPPPSELTAYFMWISAGGMLGGIATGLIAPQIFSWIVEYPLLLALAVLCRPGLRFPARGTGEFPLAAALAAAVLGLISIRAFDLSVDPTFAALCLGILIGLSVHFWRSPLALAAITALLLFGSHFIDPSYSIYQVRNFFGVLTVTESADGRFRSLWHGTTGQGAQRILDEDENVITGRPEMISEFFAGAGIAQAFDAVRSRVSGPMTFAVIGLGTGTLACQVRAGDALTFYELDPDIARIARNPKLFNFISECAPKVPIVLGDARLTLADAPDGSYDFIFVDAFLGASIPVHLLTVEAMDLYFRKLKPHGVLGMHISNSNLELASVVAGIAKAKGLIARVYDGGDVQEDAGEVKWVPRVAVLARADEDLGALSMSAFWPLRDADRTQRIWTDDYSNIAGAMLEALFRFDVGI